jgi:hypothetical protein
MTAAAAAARFVREAADAVFPVEDVERGKTHVGHFLFVKNEALIGCGVQRLWKVRSRKGGCGCASHQRKTQSGGAQSRHTSAFGQTPPLRNLLHPGHVVILHVSVQVPAEILRLARAPRKLESVHNSLPYIQFPFMLMNNAPLPSHSKRPHTVRCTATWAPRSNLNG